MYRYIPIPIRQISYISTNASNRHPINASTYLLPSEANYNVSVYQKPLENTIGYVVLYALLIIIVGSLIYILFIYSRHRYTGYIPVISMYRRAEEQDLLSIAYSYKGIAKILRELFIKVRNKIGCKYCTPRETALKRFSEPLLQLFAQLYEDVVYGSKHREDTPTVINEVKNIVEKE
ncbi:MAG: hypothetical protein QW101_03960 [Ignisphaera sp.]|uniref:DUF4129 domain-containing protein n=1 Tax=Ignisphaera aggregans TaxID=334771 RepID=A0A7J3MXA2_9CREN